MQGNTPMMKQYNSIKNENKDSILFFRLGDFYEMFGEDALQASKILDIALTSREAGGGERIPMCGVPYHSAENYIKKLIENNYKVAICEQTEDPKEAKGIVKREVVRIITPGTILEPNLLEETNNNYLVSIITKEDRFGLSVVDVSTGEFLATELDDEDSLRNEVFKYNPSECVVQEKDLNYFSNILSKELNYSSHLEYAYKITYAKTVLLEHFSLVSLDSLGISNLELATIAAGAIIDYLLITQKSKPENITNLKIYNISDNMYLDYSTKRNLELTYSLNTNSKKNSLLDVLDNTVTSLGSRMLFRWIESPLINKQEIQKRLDITEVFVNDLDLKNSLKKLLAPIYDLERITAKISFGSVNAKDLVSLKNSLLLIPEIKETLERKKEIKLNYITKNLDELKDLSSYLDRSLVSDPPFSLREGNLIKPGFNDGVDEFREITTNGKNWFLNLEKKEKKATKIKSLKIGYNKIFGYYLEITRANLDLVPDHYIRKQTLANSERYITPELKEMEAKVLGADENLKNLEYDLFVEIRKNVKKYIPRILNLAKIIAELDCFLSLAHIAFKSNYVKPKISNEANFEIVDSRHPVVEKFLDNQWFIPNDIYINSTDQRFLIITGPNMGGKSTFCRSVALSSILMQIGSFIPAQEARLPIVDRVFARIGATDNLSTGQSTFMVEMNEVANIINNATENSLIILDEVGRGTSTYDGLSIAWSLTEYIHSSIKAKTLFATHYHELTELEERLEGVKNFNVSVKESGDEIIFLRKIIPGGADQSYGIHVAKLAGLPDFIIERSKQILDSLEKNKQILIEGKNYKKTKENKARQMSFLKEDSPEYIASDDKNKEILKKLREIDLANTTPLDAINILFKLQVKAKKER